MAEDDSGTRWLILYGAQLHPARQRQVLRETAPRSSSAVIVPTAWLSWDLAGVPFIEPCFCSAIVQGYNDQEGHLGEGDSSRDEKEGDGDYRRWVWERCSPGREYKGSLPPHLEGIAYKLTAPDFEVVALRFAEGDSSKLLGEIPEAQLLVGVAPHLPRLQPTREYFMLVLRGAFLNTLSQPYLAHLTNLQPFDPTLSRLKRLSRYLFTLTLLPSFLLFYLPAQILALPAWGRFGNWLLGAGLGKTRWLERVLSRWVGSGYRNEDGPSSP
ncbi:hypothetical protein C6P46_000581 [Rhodotorula mucilaginosa]|uniref:Uncharacterized protein n=1 Tax=Rhodotorula mucilaginosa TaxID=5537 RepID=A0A9P6W554_RHOMI|nr:hypothetical protein C6P46_000581 [Rhodotorula mucilaginosa]